MKTYAYRIIIEPDERDTFHAYVPALPGCHTWGETFGETRQNIREAINVYLRSVHRDGGQIAQDLGVEIVETVAAPSLRKRSLAHA